MNLRRGENVELTREIPDLTTVVLGVRWDAGAEPALDALVAMTLLCDRRSRVLGDEHVVFFNQLGSPDLSVEQRVATPGGGDREQIEVDLPDVPAEVERVVVAVYLDDGLAVRRTLGQLRSCAIRVLDARGDRELVRSEDLAAGLTAETALVLGELYRHGRGWKFKVVGQGYGDGVRGVARDYGVGL